MKYGPNGEISRFKARFVAKGFSQVEGRDIHETYSPTAKMPTIRIVLSLAVQNRYQLRQLDIKTAYLNAKLDKEILMKQPEGFEKFDEEGKPLVCLLKKSLYGLKQSGRNWHRTLKSYLEELGFENSVFDECLFVRRIEGEIEGLICLWVDDIVVCGADKNFCSWFERNISEKFEISEISDLKWFLGMKSDYSGNEIRISQEKYVEKLISRFRMTEAKPITTLFGENEKLTKEDCAGDLPYIFDLICYWNYHSNLINSLLSNQPFVAAITLKDIILVQFRGFSTIQKNSKFQTGEKQYVLFL